MAEPYRPPSQRRPVGLAGGGPAGIPTRQTSEADLDQWNRQMRASPVYQDFLRANNLVDTGRGVKLSRGQQGALEDRLREAGIQIPGGMHIDQGGNLNQKNRLGKTAIIGAAVTGSMFIPGVGPAVLQGLGKAGHAAKGFMGFGGGSQAAGSGGGGGGVGLGGILKGIGKRIIGGGGGGGEGGGGFDLGGLGDILGNWGAGRAAGRQAEAAQLQRDDEIRAKLAELVANRATFERDSPRVRAQQAALGDLMANAQRAPYHSSFAGIRAGQAPDVAASPLFGEQARAAGTRLGQIGQEMVGEDTYEVPTLGPRPQASAMDTILNYAGPALNAYEALGGRRRQPKQGLAPGLYDPDYDTGT